MGLNRTPASASLGLWMPRQSSNILMRRFVLVDTPWSVSTSLAGSKMFAPHYAETVMATRSAGLAQASPRELAVKATYRHKFPPFVE